MRIAFIMLCHKNPEQINLLIDKLSQFHSADIFIHADMKVPSLRMEIVQKDNVYLLPEEKSFRVHWGGISMVEATLQLIQEVKSSGRMYDYIWLVSGQDYPICSVAEIESRLAANFGMNYIETILHGDIKYNRYKKLYDLKYPAWMNRNSFVVKIIKRLYMICTGGYTHTFPFFVRRKPFPFDFAFGSQWWTLTAEAAFDILEYNRLHPEILSYFRGSLIPDECFFQTMFMRGVYSQKRSGNLCFVNWGNNSRSPEILSMADIEKLRQQSEIFCLARKFDLCADSDVINAL